MVVDLVRANLELITESDVRSIAKIDAQVISDDANKYVQDNEFAYYIITNTWLHIIKEYSSYGWMYVADTLRHDGLIATIKRASKVADEFIESGQSTDELFQSIWRDVGTYVNIGKPRNDLKIGEDPLATMLMITRFPKRFSPVGNDAVKRESIKSFLDVENRVKLSQQKEYSNFIISLVRDEIMTMMNWDSIISDIKAAIRDNRRAFTSGVGFDSKATLGSKLLSISESYPEYFRQPFSIPYAKVSACQESEYWGINNNIPKNLVRVAAVPKSYKASRIIAIEDTNRQALARVIADILDRRLPANIPLHNQEVNQQLAFVGSVTDSLATIDLSNASDCISQALFVQLFPAEFVDLVLPYIPTHYNIKNGDRDVTRLMHKFATSGNSLTFIIEAIIYLAIDLAGTHCYERFSGETCLKRIEFEDKILHVPSAYGDDQVTDSKATDTVIDFLKALGFIVNEAKTYQSGPYRESCGKEYYNGVDVSSVYFPRFPILGSLKTSKINDKLFRDSYRGTIITTTTSLISLQHRLFGVAFAASLLLSRIVLASNTKMTISPPGSDCADLWGYDKRRGSATAPYAEFKDHDLPYWKRFDKIGHGRWTDNKGYLRNGHLVRITPSLPDGVDASVLSRELMLAPVTKYTLKSKITDNAIKLFEVYKYMKFLEYGPEYEDPLDELLHVSKPPMTVDEAFGTPEIVWRYVDADSDR